MQSLQAAVSYLKRLCGVPNRREFNTMRYDSEHLLIATEKCKGVQLKLCIIRNIIYPFNSKHVLLTHSSGLQLAEG